MVDVANHALQTTEQHRLSHHTEISTQWVHHLHGCLVRILVEVEVGIVASLAQRVVENLHEALAYQLLCHEVLAVISLVLIALNSQGALQLGWNLHIIISVDTENILYYVARTLNVYTISRNQEVDALSILLHDLHLERCSNVLDGLSTNLLTDEAMRILIVQTNREILHWLWIYILDLHGNLTASQLLTEDGCLLQSINLSVWIYATLKTVAGICAQTMTASALADPCRMEVSTLQDYILGCLVSTRTLTAEDTGDTHRLLSIADAQVVLTQGMLLAIESNKLGALWLGTNYNLMTGNHVCIEAVQWLAVCHHDIVGNIHDIVDRAQADDVQLILQPLRTFLHLTTGDAYTGITLASLSILDFNIDRKIFVVYHKLIARWAMQACLVAILLQPGIQVAGYPPVTERISTVGCDINLDEPVALQMVIFSSRLTYRSIFWEYDDAVVRGTYTNLILSTDHTQALYTAEFALLNGKTLVAIVKYAAQISHDNLLTCSNVRSTTDNLLRFALTQVNGCNMEVIAVRMLLACQYFTNIETFQSALDRLNFFQSVNFESARGQRVRSLLWCQIEIDVFFKPFV